MILLLMKPILKIETVFRLYIHFPQLKRLCGNTVSRVILHWAKAQNQPGESQSLTLKGGVLDTSHTHSIFYLTPLFRVGFYGQTQFGFSHALYYTIHLYPHLLTKAWFKKINVFVNPAP